MMKAKEILFKKIKSLRTKIRWQSAVGFMIVVLFVGASVLFSQDVWADFYKTKGSSGFSYGYGYSSGSYGYGYGYHRSDNKATYGYLYANRMPSASESPAQTSAVLSVTTDYLAKVKVDYGRTSGSYTTNGSYTGSYAKSANLAMSSLLCETLYYYQVTAKDIGSNEWAATEGSLTTTACTGGGGGGGGGGEEETTEEETVPTETSENTIGPDAPGEVTIESSDGSVVQLTVPAGAVESETTFTVTRSDSSEGVSAGDVGEAGGTLVMVGNVVYEISAVDADGDGVTSFGEDLTLTFTYTDDQIAGLDEGSLQIYMWDGTDWVALESTVDPDANTIYATTDHLTYFAIMTEEEEEEKPISEMTVEELKAKIDELMELINEIQAKIRALTGVEGIPSGFSFDTNLKQGMSADDVKYLQIMLNSDSETQLASSGVGSSGEETSYFGPLTRAAVVKFQEKYAEDVLAYWGLTAGTGYVGSTTREKLNELLP